MILEEKGRKKTAFIHTHSHTHAHIYDENFDYTLSYTMSNRADLKALDGTWEQGTCTWIAT